MEVIVKTDLDKLREENMYLTRMLENHHRMWQEYWEAYEEAIAELELKNKELQAEVERLSLLCMSPFK